LARGHFGKRRSALLAPQSGQPASQRYAVGTVTVGAKSRQQQLFNFRGYSMLQTLSLIVRPRPIESNYFGEQLFGQLVTHGETIRHAASFPRQGDPAAA